MLAKVSVALLIAILGVVSLIAVRLESIAETAEATCRVAFAHANPDGLSWSDIKTGKAISCPYVSLTR